MSSESDGVTSYNEYENQEGKSGMIFLIDSRLSMFTKDYQDDENLEHTKFNIALKCCRSLLMNKIIAKQKDLIGIVLFGTGKSDPETNTKHVSLLLELNYPSASAVKQLDRLLEDSNSEEIQTTYGSSEDFCLADALWFCSSLFSRSRQQLHEKKILLVTDDCDPHASHTDRAHMTRKRAKDLNKVQITLEILPMGKTDFDYSAFYKELVETVRGHPDPEVFDPDPTSRLEQLLERVNRLDYRRRRYAKIKWDLGITVFLGVSLYTLYREASVLPTETLSRKTNESVKKVKQTYDQATGELLLPSDIVEYLSIAGEDIVFTNEEKEALTKVMEPGLTLLGFKPASAVTYSNHCGQPSFVFPEESLIKGSEELMKSLVLRCIAKQKVAVCCMTPRLRAVSKYFYLIPSEETYDSNGHQLTPCGFHAIPIPFKNDEREPQWNATSYKYGELIIFDKDMESAREVVSKLRMSYKPSDFKNPKLQKFWGHLEALALDYEAPQETIDLTVPDQDVQTERLDFWSDKFVNYFDLDDEPSPGPKRKAGESSGSRKRAKNEEDEFSEEDNSNLVHDVTNAIKTNTVEKFTVAQLKAFLTIHKQKVGQMRKQELVNAVYGFKK